MKNWLVRTHFIPTVIFLTTAMTVISSCGVASEPDSNSTRPARTAPSVDPLHQGEPAFLGVVSEHNDNNPTRLVVDRAQVQLDFVKPVAGGCNQIEQSLREQARITKENFLPLGTRVLVVRAEDRGDRVFVHLLPAGSDTPEPAVPNSSVNEQLVAGGYWEPTGYQLNDDDSDYTKLYDIRWPKSMTSTEAQYAPLIVAAGNTAKSTRYAGQGECLAENEALQARLDAIVSEGQRKAEEAEEAERLRREREPVYCRDGDGDGICFED